MIFSTDALVGYHWLKYGTSVLEYYHFPQGGRLVVVSAGSLSTAVSAVSHNYR